MTRLAVILAALCLAGCASGPSWLGGAPSPPTPSTASESATHSTLGWIAVAAALPGIALIAASVIFGPALRTGVALLVVAVCVAVVPWALGLVEQQLALVAWIFAGSVAIAVPVVAWQWWERNKGKREGRVEGKAAIIDDLTELSDHLEHEAEAEPSPAKATLNRGGAITLKRFVDPFYDAGREWEQTP